MEIVQALTAQNKKKIITQTLKVNRGEEFLYWLLHNAIMSAIWILKKLEELAAFIRERTRVMDVQ